MKPIAVRSQGHRSHASHEDQHTASGMIQFDVNGSDPILHLVTVFGQKATYDGQEHSENGSQAETGVPRSEVFPLVHFFVEEHS